MANLQSLPAEIIILIANHIQAAKCPITPLAVTSKQCQMHVEPINFSRLSVRTAELPDFSQMLARSGRFLALRSLTYQIDDIPSEDPDAGSFRICEETRAAYSAVFTSAIRDLLTVLKEESGSAGASHSGIRLNLRSSRFPEKSTYLDAAETDVVEDDQDAQSDGDEDEPDAEAALERAWLKLTEEGLPVVPAVTAFRNQDGPASHLFEMVWPQSWTALASYLPSLKTVEMYAFDDERKASRSREEARTAFGLSLQLPPSTVANVSLAYLSYPPGNQFLDPPRLIDQHLGYDIFSHELALLSQRLVRLKLDDATLNLTDFFICSTQTEWPRLESLDFSSLQAACADGTWYFTMDPRMDADDYEEDPQAHTLDDMREYMEEDELPAAMDVPLNPFRTAMDREKFKDIYLAAAQAVKRMPKLRKLEISFDLQGDAGMGPGDHEFSYMQSTTESWCQESSADIKVGWGMVPAVEMDDEVMEAWREVGEAKGSSIELYLRDQNEDYYDYRLIE